MTKQQLLDLIGRMDVHTAIAETVENSDCDENEAGDAIADLIYLKEEIDRVLRQYEFQVA